MQNFVRGLYGPISGTATTSGVTVEEVDGNPSLAGITILQFNQADGLSVTQPVAGTARVNVSAAAAPDESARMLVFMSLFNRGL